MKLGESEYKLAFTMSALAEIEEKVGDIKNIETLMDGKGKIKNIIWLFTLGINSWISKKKALDPSFETKKVTEEFVGALLDFSNPKKLVDELKSAFKESNSTVMGSDDEGDDEDPNAKTA
jgi:hypothetical protein